MSLAAVSSLDAANMLNAYMQLSTSETEVGL